MLNKSKERTTLASHRAIKKEQDYRVGKTMAECNKDESVRLHHVKMQPQYRQPNRIKLDEMQWHLEL